jgi:hypothetical protein
MDALKAKSVLQRICDRERIHGGGAVRASTAVPFTRTRSFADDRAEGETRYSSESPMPSATQVA